jgi:hypothetical protein
MSLLEIKQILYCSKGNKDIQLVMAKQAPDCVPLCFVVVLLLLLFSGVTPAKGSEQGWVGYIKASCHCPQM